MNRSSNALLRPLAVLAGILLATACGGGGGGGAVEGQIFDSVVENLDYDAGQVSDTTDADGTFLVSEQSQIVFSVGDIELPEVTPATVVTPVEMVPGAEDETHPTVVRIARFLLSLDEGEDPSDGLQISDDAHGAAVGLSVEWSLDGSVDDAIADITAVTGNTPVLAADAEAHLRETLLCLLAGEWSGTYTTDFDPGDSGVWSATIDRDGMLSGDAVSDVDMTEFTLTGTVESSGDALFDDGDTFEWTGTFTRTGTASGDWVSPPGVVPPDDEGDFSGTQTAVEDCTVPAPAP